MLPTSPRCTASALAIVDNLGRLVMWHAAMLEHIGVERISSLGPLR
jgi:hypothetical protein